MQKHIVAAFLLTVVLTQISCDQSESSSAPDPKHGEVIAAEPKWEIVMTLDGKPIEFSELRGLSIFEASPSKTGSPKPQTFELLAKRFTLGGNLPAGLLIAPDGHFANTIGKPMSVAKFGGDPTASSMSKIFLDADDVAYVPKDGTLTVTKAMQLPGKFTAVQGSFDMMLQKIKLGNTDDPDNKGDQAIGEPVKATGAFTCKVRTVKFESL